MFILKYLCTSKISEYVLSRLEERFIAVYRLIFKVGLAYCFKVPSNFDSTSTVFLCFNTFLLLLIKHHGLIFIISKYWYFNILYMYSYGGEVSSSLQ